MLIRKMNQQKIWIWMGKTNEQRTERYYERGNTFPFGQNVYEVNANEVKYMEFDLIVFQTDENYLKDQYNILSEKQ